MEGATMNRMTFTAGRVEARNHFTGASSYGDGRKTDGMDVFRGKKELIMERKLNCKVMLGVLMAVVVAAASIGVSPAASAQDKRIKILNETSHTIIRFYASNIGTDDWEEDILGDDVLGVGQTVTINFGTQDYCLYDFKAVFDDGDTLVRNRINVCETSVYRYTE